MDYHHLLPPSSVLVPLRAETKQEAFDELFAGISMLRTLDRIHGLKEAVLRRELEGNTGIGHGVAVAHGKLQSLTDIFLCLGISMHGIEYGSYDGEPVRLLFVAANPPSMQGVYLHMLAVLSRYLHLAAFRERIIHSEGHIARVLLHGALDTTGSGYAISA
ncbi:PTS sugar transporter subunit IIA [Marispirochaeta aestuarii]|uniref:PTS sugar transporter subunit IIA n=1 Tax=Marispirochaeta aestuarii TaxID=1963862 RepID=UPI0029C63F72|nr:PTS sugar transporter subunit IIA [Marispirochaeta aestuarii]